MIRLAISIEQRSFIVSYFLRTKNLENIRKHVTIKVQIDV